MIRVFRFSDQFRQNALQRLVIVIIAFKLKQRIKQRSPFAIGYAKRKQKKNCKIGRFFHHNPFIVQICADDSGGNTPIL